MTCPRQPRCRVGRVRNLRQRADVAPGVFAIYPPVVVAVLSGFGDIAVETDAGTVKARAAQSQRKDAWTHLRGRMGVICGFPAAITPTHLARSSCLTKVRVVQHYPKNGQSNQGRSRRGAGWSRMSEADTRLAVRTRRSHMHSSPDKCREWLLFSKYAGVADKGNQFSRNYMLLRASRVDGHRDLPA